MAKLSERRNSKVVKILYIGDSSTGKTGSLVSLLQAGYDLRILDMDNGLDSLELHAKAIDPALLDRIDYETRRDKYSATALGATVKNPTAFVEATKLMTKWTDDSIPSEWGPQTIFVLDSLTSLGKAAFEWAKGMNQGAKDPRQWYFSAQQAIENIISMLTSEAFATNLIVISHVNYRELQDGTVKGYASAVGSALGPTLPKYFNTLVLAESSVVGKNVRRRIKGAPTSVIDLKVPIPNFSDELPLETGLATIFERIRG